jgi:hypothetical protein
MAGAACSVVNELAALQASLIKRCQPMRRER